MALPGSDGPVTLRGGVCVPLAALQLLWNLEERGLTLRLDRGALLVSPRSALTSEDDTAIRQHRADLILLLHYVNIGSPR